MRRLIKWLMIIISILLLIIGLVTFPLPIPIGLPIFLFGIAILLRYSSEAKKALLRLSKGYPIVSEMINRRNYSGVLR